ncbi:sulfotransferase [Paracoccus sp. NGMCC 1.201697]|uniref:Sulfotransferase n=1 Tax=Paracoccus broussonetiae subsp. drimophilus TaxID=3373869 RepID=A0ABW7LUN2_9RHOB
MSLPQIIGFGAQKAGTTWLFDNLATNPGIWCPVLKEMHYFNHVQSGSRWMVAKHRQRIAHAHENAFDKGDHQKADDLARLMATEIMTENWYREAYRPCPADLTSMDITPAYALLEDDALDHMGKLLGDSFRAIFLIRDPAARAISSVKKEMSEAGPSHATIDFWLEAVCKREVVIRSDYRATINRLDDKLGDRVLYLPFGMIKTDPIGLMRQIEKHCNLPEGKYKQAKKPKHVSPLVEIPEGLNEAVSILLRDQYKWLESRFDRAMIGQV